MGDWQTLAWVTTIVGFFIFLLGFSGAGRDLSGAGGAVEGLIICGFITFLGAFVLCAMVHHGQLDNTEEIQIAHAACAYATVVLVIIGLGLYGGKVSRKPPPYVTTLLTCGIAFAALAGTFGVLKIIDYE